MDLVPGERERGPKKLGAIADAAFAAYGRNAGFYLLCGVVLALVQAATAVLTQDGVVLAVQNALADALLVGIVVAGTAGTASDENPRPRAILSLALQKLWYLFALQLVIALTAAIAFELMVGESATESMGLTTAIMVYVWGLLQLPVVVAALDGDVPNPIYNAISRTVAVGLRLSTVARVTLLGLLTIPPAFLQVVIDDCLRRHGMGGSSAAIDGAVDTLLAGPYAAFIAVFYLDLKSRER